MGGVSHARTPSGNESASLVRRRREQLIQCPPKVLEKSALRSRWALDSIGSAKLLKKICIHAYKVRHMREPIYMRPDTLQIATANYSQPGTYTPNELAKKLGVKPTTVYAWLSRGELRANKVGNRRFVTEQQLKEFGDKRRGESIIDYTYANRTFNR